MTRWLLWFLLWSVSTGAYASGAVAVTNEQQHCTGGHCASSEAAACAARLAVQYVGSQYSVGAPSTYSGTRYCPVYYNLTNPIDNFWLGLGGTVASCPSNATGNATPPTSCTCNTGYVANGAGTACEAVCASTNGQVMPGAFTFTVSVATSGAVPSQICNGGCKYIKDTTRPVPSVWGCNADGTGCTYSSNSYAWFGTGAQCSATAQPAPPAAPVPSDAPLADPGPQGFCPKVIDGAVQWVPCASSGSDSGGAPAPPPVGTPPAPGASAPGNGGTVNGPSTTASSPPGTVGGSSSSSTNTQCNVAGSCTTTTTTTVNNGNGTTTTGSSTTTKPKATFCKDNPGDPNCASEEEGECDEEATNVGCAKLGTAPAPTAITSTDKALSITANSGWTHDSSCPADRVLALHGFSLSIPFTLLCEAADLARPLVILVAWVSAAFAFMGLAKRD